MVWTDNLKAMSEVYAILNQLDDSYLMKIPRDLWYVIEENATVDVSYINDSEPLENFNLERETQKILAVISYNYFCTPEEREEWNQVLEENEQRYQDELMKKYNVDNIFDNSNKVIEEDNSEENQALIEYEESFIQKVWNRILKIFKIGESK